MTSTLNLVLLITLFNQSELYTCISRKIDMRDISNLCNQKWRRKVLLNWSIKEDILCWLWLVRAFLAGVLFFYTHFNKFCILFKYSFCVIKNVKEKGRERMKKKKKKKEVWKANRHKSIFIVHTTEKC